MNLLNELNAAANSEKDIYKKLLFRRAAAMIHNLSLDNNRVYYASDHNFEIKIPDGMPEIHATERDRL